MGSLLGTEGIKFYTLYHFGKNFWQTLEEGAL